MEAGYRIAIAGTMMLASALPATAKVHTSAVATAPAVPQAIPMVILSGTPSLIEVPNNFLSGDHRSICATFRLSTFAPLTNLEVYAAGLGQAALADISATGSVDCPITGTRHDRLSLTATSAISDRLLLIEIPVNSLLGPGSSMQGSVVAIADGKKASEFSVKVEHPPLSQILTAVVWVLTILFPALITFLLGQIIVRMTAKQKEKDDFREYRRANTEAIRNFLAGIRVLIRTHNEAKQDHPGRTASGLIIEYNILSCMPKRNIGEILDACTEDNLRKIVNVLKRLFPEFPQEIKLLEEEL